METGARGFLSGLLPHCYSCASQRADGRAQPGGGSQGPEKRKRPGRRCEPHLRWAQSAVAGARLANAQGVPSPHDPPPPQPPLLSLRPGSVEAATPARSPPRPDAARLPWPRLRRGTASPGAAEGSSGPSSSNSSGGGGPMARGPGKRRVRGAGGSGVAQPSSRRPSWPGRAWRRLRLRGVSGRPVPEQEPRPGGPAGRAGPRRAAPGAHLPASEGAPPWQPRSGRAETPPRDPLVAHP